MRDSPTTVPTLRNAFICDSCGQDAVAYNPDSRPTCREHATGLGPLLPDPRASLSTLVVNAYDQGARLAVGSRGQLVMLHRERLSDELLLQLRSRRERLAQDLLRGPVEAAFCPRRDCVAIVRADRPCPVHGALHDVQATKQRTNEETTHHGGRRSPGPAGTPPKYQPGNQYRVRGVPFGTLQTPPGLAEWREEAGYPYAGIITVEGETIPVDDVRTALRTGRFRVLGVAPREMAGAGGVA